MILCRSSIKLRVAVKCVWHWKWKKFVFFFSSRRRHTRSLRDWSSDVCSSDLMVMGTFIDFYGDFRIDVRLVNTETTEIVKTESDRAQRDQIGRASCRERV